MEVKLDQIFNWLFAHNPHFEVAFGQYCIENRLEVKGYRTDKMDGVLHVVRILAYVAVNELCKGSKNQLLYKEMIAVDG